jgi:hypothetical protein
MELLNPTSRVCAREGEDVGLRFLRWLGHPHCARCQKFVITCGEHVFCDLCQECREYYETSTRSVRQFIAARARHGHRRVHARI